MKLRGSSCRIALSVYLISGRGQADRGLLSGEFVPGDVLSESESVHRGFRFRVRVLLVRVLQVPFRLQEPLLPLCVHVSAIRSCAILYSQVRVGSSSFCHLSLSLTCKDNLNHVVHFQDCGVGCVGCCCCWQCCSGGSCSLFVFILFVYSGCRGICACTRAEVCFSPLLFWSMC